MRAIGAALLFVCTALHYALRSLMRLLMLASVFIPLLYASRAAALYMALRTPRELGT